MRLHKREAQMNPVGIISPRDGAADARFSASDEHTRAAVACGEPW